MNICDENLSIAHEEHLIKSEHETLSFIIPALKESQFAKNPFRKSSNYCLKLKSANTTQSPVSFPSLLLKARERFPTPTRDNRARGNFEKLPKPSCLVAEPCDPDEGANTKPTSKFCPTRKASTIRAKTPKELTTATELEGKYEMRLTREVIHSFRKLKFIRMPSNEQLSKMRIWLPKMHSKKESSKTLFLDLDETLVHTVQRDINYSFTRIDPEAVNLVSYIHPYTHRVDNIKVILRPHVKEFLQEMSPIFEIVVNFGDYGRYSQQEAEGMRRSCLSC
eukprot:TRINITY_DN9456_c0_g5_i2.p1 TRINITY_DN9456_c0_g5~~TRINITY_DN9456_c0_g5_i2.p1  ORF type:complete len:279 (+),score=24.77 TRINITY_DN9456_c0_g5_i2:261-1097(+)